MKQNAELTFYNDKREYFFLNLVGDQIESRYVITSNSNITLP